MPPFKCFWERPKALDQNKYIQLDYMKVLGFLFIIANKFFKNLKNKIFNRHIITYIFMKYKYKIIYY